VSGADAIQQDLLRAIAKLDAPEIHPDEVALRLTRAMARGERIRDAVRRAVGANSLEGAMDATLDVILAAEIAAEALAEVDDDISAVRRAVADYARTAKVALAQAMAESGAPLAEAETHKAVPVDGKESVRVTDPALLPLEFWRVKSEPDLAAIKAALAAGQDVTGARVERGAPSLRIVAKRNAA